MATINEDNPYLFITTVLEVAGRRSLPLKENGIGWPAERRSLSESQAAEPN